MYLYLYMSGKSLITGKWIYGITWKRVHFNIFVLFIVDNTPIFNLAFPTADCFCIDGHLGGCVIAIIVTVAAAVFIQLFTFFFVFLFIYLKLFFLPPCRYSYFLVIVGVIVALCGLCVCVCVCVWLLLLLI